MNPPDWNHADGRELAANRKQRSGSSGLEAGRAVLTECSVLALKSPRACFINGALKGHGFSHVVQSQKKWGFSPRGMHAFCLK